MQQRSPGGRHADPASYRPDPGCSSGAREAGLRIRLLIDRIQDEIDRIQDEIDRIWVKMDRIRLGMVRIRFVIDRIRIEIRPIRVGIDQIRVYIDRLRKWVRKKPNPDYKQQLCSQYLILHNAKISIQLRN